VDNSATNWVFPGVNEEEAGLSHEEKQNKTNRRESCLKFTQGGTAQTKKFKGRVQKKPFFLALFKFAISFVRGISESRAIGFVAAGEVMGGYEAIPRRCKLSQQT